MKYELGNIKSDDVHDFLMKCMMEDIARKRRDILTACCLFWGTFLATVVCIICVCFFGVSYGPIVVGFLMSIFSFQNGALWYRESLTYESMEEELAVFDVMES